MTPKAPSFIESLIKESVLGSGAPTALRGRRVLADDFINECTVPGRAATAVMAASVGAVVL